MTTLDDPRRTACAYCRSRDTVVATRKEWDLSAAVGKRSIVVELQRCKLCRRTTELWRGTEADHRRRRAARRVNKHRIARTGD